MYNAGTDVMRGDSLGRLDITPAGIVERDEVVFSECVRRGVPVVMVTSGGYQRSTARVIADSILNLFRKGLIRRDGTGSSTSLSPGLNETTNTAAAAETERQKPLESKSSTIPEAAQEQPSSCA